MTDRAHGSPRGATAMIRSAAPYAGTGGKQQDDLGRHASRRTRGTQARNVLRALQLRHARMQSGRLPWHAIPSADSPRRPRIRNIHPSRGRATKMLAIGVSPRPAPRCPTPYPAPMPSEAGCSCFALRVDAGCRYQADHASEFGRAVGRVLRPRGHGPRGQVYPRSMLSRLNRRIRPFPPDHSPDRGEVNPEVFGDLRIAVLARRPRGDHRVITTAMRRRNLAQ